MGCLSTGFQIQTADTTYAALQAANLSLATVPSMDACTDNCRPQQYAKSSAQGFDGIITARRASSETEKVASLGETFWTVCETSYVGLGGSLDRIHRRKGWLGSIDYEIAWLSETSLGLRNSPFYLKF